MSTGINQSPVIIDKTGAKLENAAFKFVKRDSSGKLVLATTAGEKVVGVAVATTDVSVASGDDLTVQVKDICNVIAGAAISKGALVTTDANAKAATAAAENYIIGEALTAASAAGDVIQIQITKSGYVPKAS